MLMKRHTRLLPNHLERHGSSVREVAIHEAGHAAMAIILGDRIHWVTIKERATKTHVVSGGATHSYGGASPSTVVLVAVAGAAAERLRFKRRMAPDFADRAQALGSVSERGLGPFGRVATSLLRLHWPGVLAIAALLEERGTVRGKDALMAFSDALMPPRNRGRR